MRSIVIAAMALATEPGWAVEPRFISTGMDEDAILGVYAVIRSDCSTGTAPEIHMVHSPAHGAVVVREIEFTAKKVGPCVSVAAPARQVIYRPATGFSGQDDLTFEIVNRTTGQSDIHPVTVIVRSAPTGI